MSTAPPAAAAIRYRSTAGRWVLVATVLGSGMAYLDATVVSIALPAIGDDFEASFSSLQWTVNAYALTLAAFLLLGGSLGDHFGRRRVFMIGVAWFAAASLLCAVAPSVGMLDRRPSPGGGGSSPPHPGQPGHHRGELPARGRQRRRGSMVRPDRRLPHGVLICAVLSLAGGLLALATIRRPEEPEGVRAEPLLSCPIGGPTLARELGRRGARP